jgi:hypothetical protein
MMYEYLVEIKGRCENGRMESSMRVRDQERFSAGSYRGTTAVSLSKATGNSSGQIVRAYSNGIVCVLLLTKS